MIKHDLRKIYKGIVGCSYVRIQMRKKKVKSKHKDQKEMVHRCFEMGSAHSKFEKKTRTENLFSLKWIEIQ